ncbi:MAG: protein-L-isoaspartate(D-aspartate) O-methyltransferase [Candidatus Riflebacteria bacterium]|nr:protein-L-isoaspartate(D-aspartate) O-methyltransferase [Candidatus Riflebacteria bacterium]
MMIQRIREYGFTDEAVLKAMAAVPRHEFVPKSDNLLAYDDTPIPIGHGQTISQPYIVAEMTHQLNLCPTSRVLEIGTGSGYQAAILSIFTPHVYTIEAIDSLAKEAKERLDRLGYNSVHVRNGDGYNGWLDEAPFDGIIVTCAAGQIPPPLIEQLAPGGRLIIPVGDQCCTQWLVLVIKESDGTITTKKLMAVRFVPLVHHDVE